MCCNLTEWDIDSTWDWNNGVDLLWSLASESIWIWGILIDVDLLAAYPVNLIIWSKNSILTKNRLDWQIAIIVSFPYRFQT